MMRFTPAHPELTPKDPQKLEIWRYIHSHPTVTNPDIGAACDCKYAKRVDYLRQLRGQGVLREIRREGATRVYSVLDDETLARVIAGETPDKSAPLTEEEERILEAARSLVRFTPKELSALLLPAPGKLRLNETLRSLQGRGLLRPVKRTGATPTYSAHTQEQAHALARKRRRSAPGAIWTAIRVQKRFSTKEIFAALSAARNDITEDAVKKYCGMLVRAGYVKEVQKPQNGRPARFLLVRNTGPLPPTEKRLPVVIDSNENRVVDVQGGYLG